MVPITYQVVGEEDYALKITVGADGEFSVENGTYTTEPPRKGHLDRCGQQVLLDAIRELGIPRAHEMPEGVTAFEAHLSVGAPGEEVEYAFWEGALAEDAPLNRLVRLLEML